MVAGIRGTGKLTCLTKRARRAQVADTVEVVASSVHALLGVGLDARIGQTQVDVGAAYGIAETKSALTGKAIKLLKASAAVATRCRCTLVDFGLT
jgi:hypothetical protein